MKTTFKTIASLLLLINGVGAIYGGWHLINHPDGSSLQMTLDILKYSPFNDYLIPGMLLFTANGLFSLLVFIALLFNWKKYPLLIIAQGAVLSGWIVIQCIMIRDIHYLHILFGTKYLDKISLNCI